MLIFNLVKKVIAFFKGLFGQHEEK
ncbi:epsilon family phenol-soluble modulin [Staphylococcus epidermidis]|nr:epsilon family phenol-soluble modulin [Staphylococcus epidermidis]MBE7320269.1 epsilon family phenol-soluble modulin [Staphylococcus epidermidis]MBM0798659.1 epsilon family phenol-soluble modulin [Staphylococcus epidermidis]MBM0810260.1 epsilon family phenol-soluble modulin [Staphylococcus epidermidis]MBM0824093.1 epsilon family phenol-soluble modulin [Staphylococcus epidermidis]